MSKDLLAEATRALRETEPVSESEARATRTRVLAGLHQTRVRRRTRLAFLLPIAASFVAFSAWAAASGQARRVLDQFEQLVGITASSTGNASSRSSTKTSSRRLATPAAPDEVRSPDPAPLASSREAEPAPAATVVTRAASSARATASSSSAPDPTLALYRRAHAAHFVDHDPARALAAWDAYLSAAPNGSFAPEARYNRALSLVRLGRTGEARTALEPFANGAYGGYRQAEASALLQGIAP